MSHSWCLFSFYSSQPMNLCNYKISLIIYVRNGITKDLLQFQAKIFFAPGAKFHLLVYLKIFSLHFNCQSCKSSGEIFKMLSNSINGGRSENEHIRFILIFYKFYANSFMFTLDLDYILTLD